MEYVHRMIGKMIIAGMVLMGDQGIMHVIVILQVIIVTVAFVMLVVELVIV